MRSYNIEKIVRHKNREECQTPEKGVQTLFQQKGCADTDYIFFKTPVSSLKSFIISSQRSAC